MHTAATATLAISVLVASSVPVLAQATAPAQPEPVPSMAPSTSPAPSTSSPGATTAPTPPPAQPTVAAPPPPAAAPTRQLTVTALTDKDLEGPNANEVGDIERIVESNTDKKRYLVISRGGFLGLFETEVLVPLENVAAQGDRIVLRNMTEEQIKALPAFDKEGYRDLESSETLTLTEIK